MVNLLGHYLSLLTTTEANNAIFTHFLRFDTTFWLYYDLQHENQLGKHDFSRKSRSSGANSRSPQPLQEI
jgi:hypothetical protein